VVDFEILGIMLFSGNSSGAFSVGCSLCLVHCSLLVECEIFYPRSVAAGALGKESPFGTGLKY